MSGSSDESGDSDTGHPMSSRKFKLVEKLGEIEGQLELLQRNYKAISTSVKPFQSELSNVVAAIDSKTLSMATSSKNKLTYHGRPDENIDELLDQLDFLKIANNYTESQLFGNALLTLKSDALRWYKQQIKDDPKKFTKTVKVKEVETEIGDFDKLAKALKERFQADVTSTDLFVQVFDEKMKRGESVDAYCTRSLDTMSKMSDISESIKAGMLINGMVPSIRDQLKLKDDLGTCEKVLKYARRIEKLSFVQKSPSFSVASNEVEVNSQSSFVNVPKSGPQYRRGPCYVCQGPHLKRECPMNFGNAQGNFRGRGRGSNLRGNYAHQNMQSAATFQPSFNRGVFHYRPRGQFRGRESFRGSRGSFRGSFRGRGNFQGGYQQNFGSNFQQGGGSQQNGAPYQQGTFDQYVTHNQNGNYQGGYHNVQPYMPNAPYQYPQGMEMPTNDELFVQKQNLPKDIDAGHNMHPKN